MLSLPPAIKLGENQIVSPELAEAIEALKEPAPESLVFVTTTVPTKEKLSKTENNKTKRYLYILNVIGFSNHKNTCYFIFSQ
jgi:hypothetical protein